MWEKRPCRSCGFGCVRPPEDNYIICITCWRKGERKPNELQKVFETDEKGKTVTSCQQHPKYAGARKPRTECSGCWAWYTHLHPERV